MAQLSITMECNVNNVNGVFELKLKDSCFPAAGAGTLAAYSNIPFSGHNHLHGRLHVLYLFMFHLLLFLIIHPLVLRLGQESCLPRLLDEARIPAGSVLALYRHLHMVRLVPLLQLQTQAGCHLGKGLAIRA